ncbi:MAG: class B sortase [Actinomycetia bacterium]|nr:class B sortase [Actinomycetes bacterium]
MNSLVDFVIVILILLAFSLGCYALWDSRQVFEAADSTRYAPFRPSERDEGATFDQLGILNDEVIAWVKVYGTHIDYPIVQGRDNLTYLNTDAFGQYSLSGAIFLDYRNARDFSDVVSVLYGHHMDHNKMFGEIGLFIEKRYFEEHRSGMLYYEGSEHGLEFIAFLHTDAYDELVFSDPTMRGMTAHEYLDALKSVTLHSRDIDFEPDDRLVLLTTCSSQSTYGRDVLVARIGPDTFEDTFGDGEGSEPSKQITYEHIARWWVGVPVLFRVTLILLPLILLLLIASMRERDKKQNNAA